MSQCSRLWICAGITNNHRDTLGDIRRMLQANQATLRSSTSTTQSLRQSHPSVTIPASIYDATHNENENINPDGGSIMAASDIEFGFDDLVIDSRAYRRAFVSARSRAQAPSEVGDGFVDLVEVGDLIDLSDPLGIPNQEPCDIALNAIHEDLNGLTLQGPPDREKRKDAIQDNPETNWTAQSVPISAESEQDSLTPAAAAQAQAPAISRDIHASLLKIENPASTKPICFKCKKILTGVFVRPPPSVGGVEGQGRVFHFDCFTCAVG